MMHFCFSQVCLWIQSCTVQQPCLWDMRAPVSTPMFFNYGVLVILVKPQVVLMNEAESYSLLISREVLPPTSWKHMTCGNTRLWIHSLHETDSSRSGQTLRSEIVAKLVLTDIKIGLFGILSVLFEESHKRYTVLEKKKILMDRIQAGSIFWLLWPSVFPFLFFPKCYL